MIKVLVVDDSALMRKHLTQLLESAGGFTTRAARNGAEALAALEEAEFDVVTLDINMPVMDGITCLSRIMTANPKPVVMVSSLTQEGAEATLEALSLGAVDYVQKPDGTISLSIEVIERELISKIRAAARAQDLVARWACATGSSRRGTGKRPRAPPRRPSPRGLARALGASCWSASPPAAPARWKTFFRAFRKTFRGRSSSPSTCPPRSPACSPGG